MRGIREAILAFLLTGASVSTAMAEIVTVTKPGSGVSDSYDSPTTVYGSNQSETLGGLLTPQGFVPRFNISGSVLLSYKIFGTMHIEGAGQLESMGESFNYFVNQLSVSIGAGAVSASGISGGTADSNVDFCEILESESGDSDTCAASAQSDFELDFSGAFASVLGDGDVEVSGIGSSEFRVFCPSYQDGCRASFFAEALFLDLRVEYAYCTKPGQEGCPDLDPGVNTPGQGNNVPEPGALYLLVASLAGVAAVRRRRAAGLA